MLRDGRFVLPGGKDAEPVWADVVGVAPSDRIAFLPALFQTDSGKAAYVAAVLQQLPDALARELLLGRTGGGAKAVKRFRRLYRAIDPGGVNYELVLRDPYDFAHLARFLKLSDEGDLPPSARDIRGIRVSARRGGARVGARPRVPQRTAGGIPAASLPKRHPGKARSAFRRSAGFSSSAACSIAGPTFRTRRFSSSSRAASTASGPRTRSSTTCPSTRPSRAGISSRSTGSTGGALRATPRSRRGSSREPSRSWCRSPAPAPFRRRKSAVSRLSSSTFPCSRETM